MYVLGLSGNPVLKTISHPLIKLALSEFLYWQFGQNIITSIEKEISYPTFKLEI